MASNEDLGLQLEERQKENGLDGNLSTDPAVGERTLDIESLQDSSVKRQKVSPSERVSVTFAQVGFSVITQQKKEQATKQILRDISGTAQPGELMCIMGPSGAGKSTLLDLLADRIHAQSGSLTGSVLFNGKPRDRFFKRYSAYVPQEDVLFGVLTVKETIMFSARLNVSEHPSASELHERVDSVIQELGLTGCKDTKIGSVFYRGISGGQKRRVSIGVELVSNPSLLFMDEPTSGLDAGATFSVVEAMRRLADDGRTVLATIHQPEADVFRMFDKVLLVSAGRTVYYGATADMINYFTSIGKPCPSYTNPADHYVKMINIDFYSSKDRLAAEQSLSDLADTFEASAQNRAARLETTTPPPPESPARGAGKGLTGMAANIAQQVRSKVLTSPSATDAHGDEMSEFPTTFLHQTMVLIHRNTLNYIRNPGVFWIRLAMYVALAILVGTCFVNQTFDYRSIQNRAAVMFYVLSFFVFMTVSAIPAFIEERGVFVRERGNGAYRVSAYVVANTIASLPWIFLIALISSGICYPIIKLHQSGQAYGFFLLMLFASLVGAEAIVNFIASIAPVFMIALALGAFTFGYFMTVMGFFIQPVDLPKFWLYLGYYPAMHTYAWAAMMRNEFVGNGPWSNGQGGTLTGEQIVDDVYNILYLNPWWDFAIVLLMIAIYRFMFYWILRRYHTGKK